MPCSSIITWDPRKLCFGLTTYEAITFCLRTQTPSTKRMSKLSLASHLGLLCLFTARPGASSSASSQAVLTNSTTSTNNGCDALLASLPDRLYFPGSSVYDYEVNNFWSNTEILAPACVFRPESANDVASAVVHLTQNHSEFAVRGGGHMGIKGANSIDDGVLFVLSNLTSVELSVDRSKVTIGPGWRWGDLYSWLDTYQLGVAGGRLYPVGVPGLLLAGGVNFYGNQAGWAADNVMEYEVVLASGQIVTVSPTQNTDLFWALKGGSSNFGIVTKFTLRTFNSPKIWGGVYAAAEDQTDAMMAAIANYSAFNTDPLSHLVAMTAATGPNTSYPAAIMFYDSPNVSYPDCFAAFFDIPATSSSLDFKSLVDLATETAVGTSDGYNDMFIAGTFVGKDYATLLQGIQITNEIFFAHIPKLYAVVSTANVILSTLNWQPIGSLWTNASKVANPVGNALGLDTETKGTYIAWAETVEWAGSEYDDIVVEWATNTTDAINAATRAAGIYDSFTYMGDASGFQLDEVFAGYGAQNVERLLNVSRKYDPQRVFQKLLPGGFKIGL